MFTFYYNIAKILADSDRLESKLDEVVGRVGHEAEKSSDDENIAFSRSRERRSPTVPPFSHRAKKSSSSDEEGKQEFASLSDLASSDTKNSSLLKSNSYLSPKSVGQNDESDHSVQELLRTTERLLRASPPRRRESPAIGEALRAAQKAIAMPLASAKGVKEKVERRTMKWT